MRERNLSPLKMFIELAARHRPKFAFDASVPFEQWKQKAKPEVLKVLGDWPETVEPNVELASEWLDRGVCKRRYLIDVSSFASVALQVNLPKNVDGPAPAILCWHGHGPHGKDAVMGNAASKEIRDHIQEFNYDYGHQMAERGFVTFAFDWMGIGERCDNNKPHFFNHDGGRDWCNLYYLNATMLGMTSLSINLAHGRAATDFICSLPEVDPARLAVMGLSGGGTMTLWSALLDERFKAAEIICYSDLWARFGIRDLNYCGMQVAPGLYKLVDLPDLQGLLAPLPLLITIGAHDTCFHSDNALTCFRIVRQIYAAAEASDRLELDFFPGGHQWHGVKTEEFLRSALGTR